MRNEHVSWWSPFLGIVIVRRSVAALRCPRRVVALRQSRTMWLGCIRRRRGLVVNVGETRRRGERHETEGWSFPF